MLDKTMQIFVMNIEGKTVTIDVEPRDIIKTVKEKLQVNRFCLIVSNLERAFLLLIGGTCLNAS